MSQDTKGVPIILPQTIYAVAMTLAKDGNTYTACRMFVVSGDRPLTDDEAVERAKKLIPDGYKTTGTHVVCATQK